jgi:LDH2 family malate/lactate/ureidoglycolate dehydrogenase
MATTTITAEDLTALATAILADTGVADGHARNAARVLVEGDLMGIGTHGVDRLFVYTDRLRRGGMNPKAAIRVEDKAPSLALVDGDNGLGPAVGWAALEAVLRLARDTGIAYVGVRRSNHFGALAPYALAACEAGFVMIAGTSASTTMAPWGGREVRIGNNPLAIAAPVPGGPHFILDMAMSVAARGKIRAARDSGEPIPAGWAADANGLPTTDPVAALKGFLLPVGGHKGSGLSQAVDILSGALSGAAFLTGIASWVDKPDEPSGLGHFFILIDPARLLSREAFGARMAEFRDTIRGTPAAEADKPVLFPGEREQARRATALRDGIALPGDTLAHLRALVASAA